MVNYWHGDTAVISYIKWHPFLESAGEIICIDCVHHCYIVVNKWYMDYALSAFCSPMYVNGEYYIFSVVEGKLDWRAYWMSNIAGMITTNFYLVCEELRIDFSPPIRLRF